MQWARKQLPSETLFQKQLLPVSLIAQWYIYDKEFLSAIVFECTVSFFFADDDDDDDDDDADAAAAAADDDDDAYEY